MSVVFRDNAPFSEAFGDIYFNPEHGLAETEYVFLQANQLETRLSIASKLSIGELGFGTGLNFLATLKLWQSLPEPKAELHYFSIEKYPLNLAELQRAHGLFPELQNPAKLLQVYYPTPIEGFHAIAIIPNRVYLYLLIGDVSQMLPQMEGPIDTWFLDGFAPKKNAEMWSETVLQEIGKRSHRHTTLSTFSAAGSVRKNLEAVGFQVQKIKGFGIKNEMITAQFSRDYKNLIDPWFAKPASIPEKSKVAVIGAGLSGLMNAYHLHEAGFHVEIFDEASSLPNHQSQNPVMQLKPYISPNLNFFDQYYTQGFLGMTRFIKKHAPEAIISEGLLDIIVNDKKQEKLHKITEKRVIPQDFAEIIDARQSSHLAGIKIPHSAIYYPSAQIVDPARLVLILLQILQGLPVHLGKKMDPFALRKDFDAVVVATGAYIPQEWEESFCLAPSPGQVSIAKQTSISQKLKLGLTYEGYCIPKNADEWVLGSSFRHHLSLDILDKDHQQNIHYLEKAAPELAESFKNQTMQGFAGIRLKARDHLPLVGGLPVQEQWFHDFDRLRHGDFKQAYPDATYENQLYLTLAHGSKGLSSSFMASKILTSLLSGRPLPIGLPLWDALQPARFWLRTLKCAD